MPGDDLAAPDRRPHCAMTARRRRTYVVVIAHKVVSKAEGRIRSAGRRGAGAQSASARPRTRQGPAPRAGRARRVARGAARRARRPDLRDPPRLRLRERRASTHPTSRARGRSSSCRRIRTARLAGSARAPARATGRRPGGPDHRLVRAGVAPRTVRRRDRLRRALTARGLAGADRRRRARAAAPRWIAIADELAAAADLARTKDGRQPVVLVGGAEPPRHSRRRSRGGGAATARGRGPVPMITQFAGSGTSRRRARRRLRTGSWPRAALRSPPRPPEAEARSGTRRGSAQPARRSPRAESPAAAR